MQSVTSAMVPVCPFRGPPTTRMRCPGGCSHNQPYQRTTTVGKNPKTTDISILKPSKNYTEMSAVSCICSSLSCPRMTEMSTWSRAPGGSSSTLIPPYSTRTTCLNADSCGKCVGEKHLLPFGTADCESTLGVSSASS